MNFSPTPNRTRLNRRDLLQVGCLSALGIGLGGARCVSRSFAAAPRREAKAKACVLVWLDGGPSHLETFDPKPDAPSEVRGPLKSIATNVPGIALSECLPQTAKILDRVAIIRSMTSPLGEHNFGTHYLMTGFKPTPVLEYPTFAAVGTHVRQVASTLPANVAIPDFRVGGSKFSGGGFLPRQVHPFEVGGDPAKPDFAVRDLEPPAGMGLPRLARRREFAAAFDRLGAVPRPSDGTSTEVERAFELVASAEARKAFDLHDEPAKSRQRYGPRTVGQSCLLARRLLERGVPFVTVNQTGWDTHDNLYTRLKEGYTGAQVPVGLVPSLDTALSALVLDLEERGMLEETLIVVMGEFGRTPKLNTQGGRDHWPRVFSAALAGGGVRGGQVIGASDSVGESPADRPVTPADLVATIYELLGIDRALELHTADGRPVRVTPPEARVIEELL